MGWEKTEQSHESREDSDMMQRASCSECGKSFINEAALAVHQQKSMVAALL